MKRFLTSRPLVFILLTATAPCLSISCKKDNNAPALALLQHKWQIVSLNGEAFRYVGNPGDYMDFGTNNQLVEFMANSYDTLNYQVIDGGRTLQLFPKGNRVPMGGSISYTIKTLNSNQLILGGSGSTPPTINILDSLSRQ